MFDQLIVAFFVSTMCIASSFIVSFGILLLPVVVVMLPLQECLFCFEIFLLCGSGVLRSFTAGLAYLPFFPLLRRTLVYKYLLKVHFAFLLIAKNFQLYGTLFSPSVDAPLSLWRSWWMWTTSLWKKMQVRGHRLRIGSLKFIFLTLRCIERMVFLPFIFPELKERILFSLRLWYVNVYFYFWSYASSLYLVSRTFGKMTKMRVPRRGLRGLLSRSMKTLRFVTKSSLAFFAGAGAIRLEDAQFSRYFEQGYPVSWGEYEILYPEMLEPSSFHLWTLHRDFDHQLFLHIKKHFQLPVYLDPVATQKAQPSGIAEIFPALRDYLVKHNRIKEESVFDNIMSELCELFYDDLRLVILEELQKDPLVLLRLCFHHNSAENIKPILTYSYDSSLIERVFLKWQHYSGESTLAVLHQKVERFVDLAPDLDLTSRVKMFSSRGYLRFFHDDWKVLLSELFVETYLIALPYEFFWGKAFILHGMILPFWALWAKPFFITPPFLFLSLHLSLGLYYLKNVIEPLDIDLEFVHQKAWWDFRLKIIEYTGIDIDLDDEDLSEIIYILFLCLIIPVYYDMYCLPYHSSRPRDYKRSLLRTNRRRHQGSTDFLLERFNEEISPLAFWQYYHSGFNYRRVMLMETNPFVETIGDYPFFFASPYFEILSDWTYIYYAYYIAEMEDDAFDEDDFADAMELWHTSSITAEHHINASDEEATPLEKHHALWELRPQPPWRLRSVEYPSLCPIMASGIVKTDPVRRNVSLLYGEPMPLEMQRLKQETRVVRPVYAKNEVIVPKLPPLAYNWATFWERGVNLDYTLMEVFRRADWDFKAKQYYQAHLRTMVIKFMLGGDREWTYIYRRFGDTCDFARALLPPQDKERRLHLKDLTGEDAPNDKEFLSFDEADVDMLFPSEDKLIDAQEFSDVPAGAADNMYFNTLRLELQRQARLESIAFANQYFDPSNEGTTERGVVDDNDDEEFYDLYADWWLGMEEVMFPGVEVTDNVIARHWRDAVLYKDDASLAALTNTRNWIFEFEDVDANRDSGIVTHDQYDLLEEPELMASLIKAGIPVNRLRPITHNDIVTMLRLRNPKVLPMKVDSSISPNIASRQLKAALAQQYLTAYEEQGPTFPDFFFRSPIFNSSFLKYSPDQLLEATKLDLPYLENLARLDQQEKDLLSYLKRSEPPEELSEEQKRAAAMFEPPKIRNDGRSRVEKLFTSFFSPFGDDGIESGVVYTTSLAMTPEARREFEEHYEKLIRSLKEGLLVDTLPFTFSDEETSYAMLLTLIGRAKADPVLAPLVSFPGPLEEVEGFLPFVSSDEDQHAMEQWQDLMKYGKAQIEWFLKLPGGTLTGMQQLKLRKVEDLQSRAFIGDSAVSDSSGFEELPDIVWVPPTEETEFVEVETDYMEIVRARHTALHHLKLYITGTPVPKPEPHYKSTHVAPVVNEAPFFSYKQILSKRQLLRLEATELYYPKVAPVPNVSLKVSSQSMPFFLSCYRNPDLVVKPTELIDGNDILNVPQAGEMRLGRISDNFELDRGFKDQMSNLQLWNLRVRERIRLEQRPLKKKEVGILTEFLNTLVLSPNELEELLISLGLTKESPEWRLFANSEKIDSNLQQYSPLEDEIDDLTEIDDVVCQTKAEELERLDEKKSYLDDYRVHIDELADAQVAYNRALRVVSDIGDAIDMGTFSKMLGGEVFEKTSFFNEALAPFEDKLLSKEKVVIPRNFFHDDVWSYYQRPHNNYVIPPSARRIGQKFLEALADADALRFSSVTSLEIDLLTKTRAPVMFPKAPDDILDTNLVEGTAVAGLINFDMERYLSQKTSTSLLANRTVADHVITPVVSAGYVSSVQLEGLMDYITDFLDFELTPVSQCMVNRVRLRELEADGTFYGYSEFLTWGVTTPRKGPLGRLQPMSTYSKFSWETLQVELEMTFGFEQENLAFLSDESLFLSYDEEEAIDYPEVEFEEEEDFQASEWDETHDHDEHISYISDSPTIWDSSPSFGYLKDQALLVGVYQATQLINDDRLFLLQLSSLYTPVDLYGVYTENSLGYSPLRWFDVYDPTHESVLVLDNKLQFEFNDGVFLNRHEGYSRSPKTFRNISNEYSTIDNVESLATGFYELEKIAGLEYAVVYYTHSFFGVSPGQLLEALLYSTYWASSWLQAIYHAAVVDTPVELMTVDAEDLPLGRTNPTIRLTDLELLEQERKADPRRYKPPYQLSRKSELQLWIEGPEEKKRHYERKLARAHPTKAFVMKFQHFLEFKREKRRKLTHAFFKRGHYLYKPTQLPTLPRRDWLTTIKTFFIGDTPLKDRVDERIRLEEERRLLVEERTRAEEERRAVEQQRLEAQQRLEEERQRRIEGQRRFEEERQRRIEGLRRIDEEYSRREEEQQRRVEEQLRAEEYRRAVEQQRVFEEQQRLEAQQRLEERRRAVDEQRRAAERQRVIEERFRIVEEQLRLEEQQRLEAQLPTEERQRIVEERQRAEEYRRAVEQRRREEEQQYRLLDRLLRGEEKQRREEEQLPTEERQRLAEERRRLEEGQRFREERIREEAERRRAAEERVLHRLAEQQRAEEEQQRVFEEQRRAAARQRRMEERTRRAEEEQLRAIEAQLLPEERQRLAERRRAEEQRRRAHG